MRPADSISVSVQVDVDVATAFEVFTREVDLWWRHGPAHRGSRSGVLRFDPGAGGRLVEVEGGPSGEVHLMADVLVWDPPRRIELAWRAGSLDPAQATHVTICFEPAGTGTRVTVEHGRWSVLPPDAPARHGLDDAALQRSWAGWWSGQLGALRRFSRTARRDPDPPLRKDEP